MKGRNGLNHRCALNFLPALLPASTFSCSGPSAFLSFPSFPPTSALAVRTEPRRSSPHSSVPPSPMVEYAVNPKKIRAPVLRKDDRHPYQVLGTSSVWSRLRFVTVRGGKNSTGTLGIFAPALTKPTLLSVIVHRSCRTVRPLGDGDQKDGVSLRSVVKCHDHRGTRQACAPACRLH